MTRAPSALELAARDIVCGLTGAVSQWFDDGTAESRCDWLLTMRDGTVQALEVTSVQRIASVQVEQALHKHGARRDDKRLSRRWQVMATDQLRVTGVHDRLLDVLVASESAGIYRLVRAHGQHDSAVAAELGHALGKLGFGYASGFPAKGNGGFVITPPSVAGWVTGGDGFATWVQLVVDSPECIKDAAKLRAAPGSSAGHLFVWLGTTRSIEDGVQDVLQGRTDEPRARVALPVGIDRVWVSAEWTTSHALTWESSIGWMRVPKAVDRFVDPVLQVPPTSAVAE